MPRLLPYLLSLVAMAVTMLVLDLAWLGVVMAEFYDRHLGALRAAQVHVPAAAAFYALYLSATCLLAWRAPTQGAAWLRGAALGFYAYGVYELTNWAVLAGWPAALVAPDWAWGVVLTSTVTWVGYRVRAAAAGTPSPVPPSPR